MNFKKIFSPLGYNYLNIKGHHLMVKDSPGIGYFGTFKYKKNLYKFNNSTYTTPEELVEAIKKHNDTLIVPADFYCPFTTDSYKFEGVFKWYAEQLGFKYSHEGNYDTVSLKNIYNNTIIRLTLQGNDIIREFSSGSWVQSSFTTFEEELAAINSIIEPELLTNVSTSLKVLENLTNHRTDVTLGEIQGFNIYVQNAKETTKKALQEALDRLNDN